jgi:hypothetical protein
LFPSHWGIFHLFEHDFHQWMHFSFIGGMFPWNWSVFHWMEVCFYQIEVCFIELSLFHRFKLYFHHFEVCFIEWKFVSLNWVCSIGLSFISIKLKFVSSIGGIFSLIWGLIHQIETCFPSNWGFFSHWFEVCFIILKHVLSTEGSFCSNWSLFPLIWNLKKN